MNIQHGVVNMHAIRYDMDCGLVAVGPGAKSQPVMRPLACNEYSCAPFTAKPNAACALRFSSVATSCSYMACANMTSCIEPEVHNVSLRRHADEDRATAIGNTHTNFAEDWTCSSEEMVANRQTHKQTDTVITVLRSSVGDRGVISDDAVRLVERSTCSSR